MTTPTPRHRASRLLATWFGCGHAPWAPGTAGTLGAVPLAWLVSRLPGAGVQWAAVALFSAAVMPAAHRAGLDFGEADASQIVVDEVAGYLVSLAAVPWSPAAAAWAFLLFRLFDIGKPWPARYFDRQWKNGPGVVLDDLCAGLYARAGLAVLRVASRRFHLPLGLR